MIVDSSFGLPIPPAVAWPILLDIPLVARCVPGAQLQEDSGSGRYRGTITLSVGPVQLTFGGTLQLVDVDETTGTAKMLARGSDAKGRGNATATVAVTVTERDGGSMVDLSTDLQLTGSIAQYGRAEGLLRAVANEMAQRFSGNLQSEILRKDRVEHEPSPAAAAPPVRPLSVFGLIWATLKSAFLRRGAGARGGVR